MFEHKSAGGPNWQAQHGMPKQNFAASNPESLQETEGQHCTLGRLLRNTLKFNHRRHLSSRSADYQFLVRYHEIKRLHLLLSCTDKSHACSRRNLAQSGKNGSGNASDEHGEIPTVGQPRRPKRRQRTIDATIQSGSSRSPLNRSHLWATF